MSETIEKYLAVVFGSLPDRGFVNLRGIGEKGTPKEGKFMDDKFIDLAEINGDPEKLAALVKGHVDRWNEHGIGSFIVPAILSAPQGVAKNVFAFGSIVVDIDSGDIPTKLQLLSDTLGEPTAIVFSGGTTEDGHQKRHAYWTLADPCQDIPGLIRLRHRVAQGGGGDMMFGMGVVSNPFGRAHQPVRIAGSVHNKNGKATPVTLHPVSMRMYDIADLETAAGHLPAPETPELPEAPPAQDAPKKPLMLDQKVHEGGTDDDTRWARFSRTAGFYISLVRKGEYTLDQARELTRTWMELNMVPPWDPGKFQAEFAGLVNKDLGEKGEIKAPVKNQKLVLDNFVAARNYSTPPPPRPFVVRDLIIDGKHQLFAAEGGAGKTFLFLDLALQVASNDPANPNTWLGRKVENGGTVVYITSEDDHDEIHNRLWAIDPDKKFMKAGKKLIIIPLIDAGGSFNLVQTDPRTGAAGPSPRWAEFLDVLAEVKDLRLVMVDTMNSALHGAENEAVVINEFVRELTKVVNGSGKKPAMVVSHHVRKQGDEPIRNAEDMLAAIRGSSAITAAFRSVIGMWQCPDYTRRMTAMGHEPARGQLWKLGICKANNPEMLKTELTLLRSPSGLLVNVTEQDRYNDIDLGEHHAWLFAAIREAAIAGHPYSQEGKNSRSGLYKRRSELPSIFSHTGPGEFTRLVDNLLMDGQIVATAAKGGRDKKWLDVPDGPIAGDSAGAELSSGAYTPPIWRDWVYDSSNNFCRNKYNK